METCGTRGGTREQSVTCTVSNSQNTEVMKWRSGHKCMLRRQSHYVKNASMLMFAQSSKPIEIIIVCNKEKMADIVLWIYLLSLFWLCITSGMWLNRPHSVAFFACQQCSLCRRRWYQKGYLFIQLFQNVCPNVCPNVNKLSLNFCGSFYSRFFPPVAIALNFVRTCQQNNLDVDVTMAAIVMSTLTSRQGHIHVNVL